MIDMVEISEKELVTFEAILSDMENVINGDDELDGLELYYSECTYQHKRLRKILDNLVSKYNSLYGLWERWYDKKQSMEDAKDAEREQHEDMMRHR